MNRYELRFIGFLLNYGIVRLYSLISEVKTLSVELEKNIFVETPC